MVPELERKGGSWTGTGMGAQQMQDEDLAARLLHHAHVLQFLMYCVTTSLLMTLSSLVSCQILYALSE